MKVYVHNDVLQSTDTDAPGDAGGADEVGGASRGGVVESVQESCRNVRESLDHVIRLLGRLSLSWRAMETELEGEGENCWVVGEKVETFLRDQVRFSCSGFPVMSYGGSPIQGNREVCVGFYRGQCEWSRLRLESSCYCIQSSLTALQSALHSEVRVCYMYCAYVCMCVCGLLLPTKVCV